LQALPLLPSFLPNVKQRVRVSRHEESGALGRRSCCQVQLPRRQDLQWISTEQQKYNKSITSTTDTYFNL